MKKDKKYKCPLCGSTEENKEFNEEYCEECAENIRDSKAYE